ncbi:MAG TPA: site-specific integrase [Smithellaceae bacterium]|nr:site-specific integrase [Smithellaceae bacterium]HRV45542.1 site-specific integrase [Smithellaceae bacterium]
MKVVPTPETQVEKKPVFPDAATVHQKIREALRIKHYAYSTGKTYTGWFQRFYDYLTNIKKKDWETQGADEEDVRDFLSHLAIKQHVSSSTQNQAFNALLFIPECAAHRFEGSRSSRAGQTRTKIACGAVGR